MNYRMKDVIGQTGLTEKAIRLYIDKKLIMPIIEEKGNRNNVFFSDEQITELKQIGVLRLFDFSMQEIEVLLHGTKGEQKEILLECKKKKHREEQLLEVWNHVEQRWEKMQSDISSDRDRKEVSIAEMITDEYYQYFKNDILKSNFAKLDSEEKEQLVFVKDQKLSRIVCILLGIFAVVTIFVTGFQYGRNRQQAQNDVKQHTMGDCFYSVQNSELFVEDIVWKDYPGWKTVNFQLTGVITVKAPKGAGALLTDYQFGTQRTEVLNPEAWEEIARENRVLSDGEDLIYYDEISYKADSIKIIGTVTNCADNSKIQKAANGYYLTIHLKDPEIEADEQDDYIVGAILPGAQEMQFWSQKENKYAGRNLSVYLDAFHISRTYSDDTALDTKVEAEGVLLEKGGASVFDCVIKNERKEEWCYLADVPALELWYDGIWIEVKSPYASNLMVQRIETGEEKQWDHSNIEKSYPYLIPGLYRLVIYGQEGDFIATEPFEVQE